MINSAASRTMRPRDLRSLLRMGSPRIRKARCALLHIRTDRLGLVRTADQLLLLDGFGEQRGSGIDGELVEHALGSADRVRALAGDLERKLERGRSRVVANPGGEAIGQR